ncbi:hypothetical protein [Mesorhizobium sp. M0185]|uniref:P-loop ATPase, Sll1717 family n=1 Tax=Mesorhizobium sp. M0185 TaxID=2956907 RepID=UPI00333635B8
MTLVATLEMNGNPFEHYTAETEPNIADYAVRPPYLEAISARARGLSSFILFGDRGAGKSAKRITVYNEIWKEASKKKSPFVLNLTDYSAIHDLLKKDKLADRDIVGAVAFAVVEQILVWLSSLENDERQIYIDGLNPNERTLMFALMKGFYLSVSEMDREVSTSDALRLLNSAWTTKSAVWIGGQWEALSKIIAAAVNALSKHQLDNAIDISAPAEALLKSLTGEAPNTSKAILIKLVDLVKAFGYIGICVLVDKVDETPSTANSAEATARLIHPLLSHIQLLEIAGFSWILFLWSNVQNHFNAKYPVRLDKIAHANITWNVDSLREMIDSRVKFFSDGRYQFDDLLVEGMVSKAVFDELVSISVSSPRELIKLMDFVVREHDARGDAAPPLVDQSSLNLGQDKYALETIGGWFSDKPLQQVLRLGKTSFVNKDVQSAFKIGDQGARVKIASWEDAGLVRQSGTLPSELGGKPVYRFIVADSRVERIISRKLADIVGAELEVGEEGSGELLSE